ncbi:MAG: bifunctional DNA-formamidopyrimidine glycosylase/DNA-(apurinic or apyrimidinic site) lyase [Zetaproteobacteria bacterium]|nr:MAG: bifunctional DNA-formamidopyrimidine glycosylase/DNA-(apurinic or apyrimidinic site) lyase [Zetaproteobacteria bacterium]
MPELPEVETVRRGLQRHLPGRRIVAVHCSGMRLRRPWPERMEERLVGRRFTAVRRRAKYLLLETDGAGLLCHLGMSGCLRILPPGGGAPAHQHWRVDLDDGAALSFADPRRFGLVDLVVGKEGWRDHPLLCRLGPEPLERSFTGTWLQEVLRGRRRSIKALLLDGRIVAGIGNIYANEALFAAGIDPRRPGGALDAGECARLAGAIRSVLTQAVAVGGSTIRDFVGSDGQPGYFAHRFRCYGREGGACPRCGGGRIVRIRQEGRSSFLCPLCQPPGRGAPA